MLVDGYITSRGLNTWPRSYHRKKTLSRMQYRDYQRLGVYEVHS